MSVRSRRWQLVRARREAVPASVRRLSSLRSRRPRFAPVAVGCLALLLVGGLVWVVWGTSLLGVRVVDVHGSTLVPAGQVRAVAAVAEGTPLARIDTDAVEARVRTLVPVAEVDVYRSWPRTLVISLIERVAVAVVAAPDGFRLVDSSGVAFHTVPGQPSGTPLLRVATPGPSDAATRAGLRVLAALTPALRQVLSAIVAETPNRIKLELTTGTVVVWGDADQSETKAAVATALLPRKPTTIDVTAPDVATTS